jgi:hypothetical protein
MEIDALIAEARLENRGRYVLVDRARLDYLRDDILKLIRRARRRRVKPKTELAALVAGEMNAPDPYSV